MFDFDENNFVDLSKLNIYTPIISKQSIKYDFNKTTTETYRVMRYMCIDPITHEKVPPNLDFTFDYMWDPITGDRIDLDPYGGFHFNVLNLAMNFYYNRLRMLWTDGETIDGIKYEGYYGDALCSGEDLYVSSRGISKHMHLFRLPIIDCYLTKDFNYSITTMGPKLTNEEIDKIQNIIDVYYKNNKKIKKIYSKLDNNQINNNQINNNLINNNLININQINNNLINNNQININQINNNQININQINNNLINNNLINNNLINNNQINNNQINLRLIRDLYSKAISKISSEKDARHAVDELKLIM